MKLHKSVTQSVTQNYTKNKFQQNYDQKVIITQVTEL